MNTRKNENMPQNRFIFIFIIFQEGSGHSGDGSDIDDNEYDRDDYSSSMIPELRRTTRDRYRRSIDEEIAEFTGKYRVYFFIPFLHQFFSKFQNMM